MKTDRTTKLLLLIIAAGLWLNVAAEWATPVRAQDFSTIEKLLKTIEFDLGRIQRGTCTNGTIC